jgi:hypothetical protein
MNIQINYLYRDAGNFKSYGFVVFNNPTGLRPGNVESILRSEMFDSEFFVAAKYLLPDLRPTVAVDALDHGWHEVECVVETLGQATDAYQRSINTLLQSRKANAQYGSP